MLKVLNFWCQMSPKMPNNRSLHSSVLRLLPFPASPSPLNLPSELLFFFHPFLFPLHLLPSISHLLPYGTGIPVIGYALPQFFDLFPGRHSLPNSQSHSLILSPSP